MPSDTPRDAHAPPLKLAAPPQEDLDLEGEDLDLEDLQAGLAWEWAPPQRVAAVMVGSTRQLYFFASYCHLSGDFTASVFEPGQEDRVLGQGLDSWGTAEALCEAHLDGLLSREIKPCECAEPVADGPHADRVWDQAADLLQRLEDEHGWKPPPEEENPDGWGLARELIATALLRASETSGR